MREIILTRDQFDSISQAVLEAGGCLRFEAHGYSMHPLLRNNDVITVRPANNCELTPGAIVLYRSAHNRLMVHRIAESDKTDTPDDSLLLIHGDANPGQAELIGKDDVLGIISHVERGSEAFRVDRGPWSLLGRIIARHRNLVPWILAARELVRRPAERLLRVIQSQSGYRKLLYKILAHKVRCDVHKDKSGSEFKLSMQTLFTEFQQNSGESHTISAILRKREAGSVRVVDRFVSSEETSGWWLVDLRVHPVLRGAGIGEQLVRRAIELALNERVARLNVLVNASNRPALFLYWKLGFQRAPEPLHAAIIDATFPHGNTSFIVMSLDFHNCQARH